MKKEKAYWGTVVSADLKAGHTYMLSTSTIKTDSSYFGEIPAFIVLQDEEGNDVQTAYSFFHPTQKENFTIAWTRRSHVMFGTNPNFDFMPLSYGERIMAEAGAEIAAEMSEAMMNYINALNQFLIDLDARKQNLKQVSQ